MPEARIQQVQNGMLDAADVEVQAARIAETVQLRPRTHPVRLVLPGAELFFVGRVDVAQLIPRASGPLRHDIGVTLVLLRTVAEIEFDVDPVRRLLQRRTRFAVGVVGIERDGRVVLDLRKLNGQHRFGQCVRATLLVVDDRERLAPVALTSEEPVAQFVLHGALSGALLFEPLDDRDLRVVDFLAVEEARVHQRTVADVRLLRDAGLGADDLDDGQSEDRRELVVA